MSVMFFHGCSQRVEAACYYQTNDPLVKCERFVGMHRQNPINRLAPLCLFGGEDLEWQLCEEIFDKDTPFRVQMTAFGVPLNKESVDFDAQIEHLKSLRNKTSDRMHFGKSVKLVADGGFFSNLMQLQWPGRIDGRDGHWITSPEVFRQAAKAFWDAGFVIHVHTSADLGLELVLDTLEHLQAHRPRFGRKFVIEHLGALKHRPKHLDVSDPFGGYFERIAIQNG
jgi:hypothetical protein